MSGRLNLSGVSSDKRSWLAPVSLRRADGPLNLLIGWVDIKLPGDGERLVCEHRPCTEDERLAFAWTDDVGLGLGANQKGSLIEINACLNRMKDGAARSGRHLSNSESTDCRAHDVIVGGRGPDRRLITSAKARHDPDKSCQNRPAQPGRRSHQWSHDRVERSKAPFRAIASTPGSREPS